MAAAATPLKSATGTVVAVSVHTVPAPIDPDSTLLSCMDAVLVSAKTMPELTGRVLALAVLDCKLKSVTLCVRTNQSEKEIIDAVSSVQLKEQTVAMVTKACKNSPITCLLCTWVHQPLVARVLVFE